MSTALSPTVHSEQGEHLAEFVRAQWTDLCVRLGERTSEFVEVAQSAAAARQLRDRNCIARFVNLCCVFGPRFEQQKDNQWALAILAEDRLADWAKLHQLVVRGAKELKCRGPEGEQAAARLLLADAALLDRVQAEAARIGVGSASVPRQACDLEAIQIALVDSSWRRGYEGGGAWRLLSLQGPSPLRIGRGQPAPQVVTVLARPRDAAPAAAIEVAIASQGTCAGDRHPLVTFAGVDGVSTLRGELARMTTWPLHAPAAQVPAPGFGPALLQETAAEPSRLRVSTCGLRDEGLPTGDIDLYVCTYPADQHLLELQRTNASAWQRPVRSGSASPAKRTRCRLERDGQALPTDAWKAAFDEGLDAAMVRGFETLFTAWQATARDATMSVTADFLCGTAHLVWGWHEGEGGLAGPPDLHVHGHFDLANTLDVALAGEMKLGSARARVRLRVQGAQPMKHELRRTGSTPSLQELALAAACRWRFGYRLEFDAIAVDEGAVWSDAGACAGAIVGEFGLRPRTQGGGGWQWYGRIASEAVSVPVGVHDPVLGRTREVVQLLPARALLDWSAG